MTNNTAARRTVAALREDLAVLSNPYTPGQTPRFLAGRARERDEIEQRLTRVETLGEFGGPLVAFHAPRGLGKTSLLRNALEEVRPRGFLPVWVAAAQRTALLPELVHNIERAVGRNDAYPDPPRGWSTRLAEVRVEVGLPGAKVGATFDTDTSPADTRPEDVANQTGPADTRAGAPIAAVQDLLVDTADLVRSSGGAGLVVFIDEVHAAPTADLAILLNALQNIDGERYDHPLAVFTAGLPSTPAAFTRAATFGERTTFVELSPLTETEAIRAIADPALDAGVTWDPGALRTLVAAAAGNPYYLQLYGSATWNEVRPDRGTVIAAGEVDRGLEAARGQIEAIFAARWGAATPTEKELILAMVTQMRTTGGDRASRAGVAEHMGRTSSSLAVARNRLMEKGIVEGAGHGYLRFVLPGFTDYVIEVAGT